MNINTTSNLHAANATSVVGSSIAIPPRATADAAAISQPATQQQQQQAAAAAAAAASANATLNQMRAAFKPVVGVPVPVSAAAVPVAVAAAAVNAPPAPVSVPNTAGAGALQLTGRWSLDRDDSDSTNDYLEAMVRSSCIVDMRVLHGLILTDQRNVLR